MLDPPLAAELLGGDRLGGGVACAVPGLGLRRVVPGWGATGRPIEGVTPVGRRETEASISLIKGIGSSKGEAVSADGSTWVGDRLCSLSGLLEPFPVVHQH